MGIISEALGWGRGRRGDLFLIVIPLRASASPAGALAAGGDAAAARLALFFLVDSRLAAARVALCFFGARGFFVEAGLPLAALRVVVAFLEAVRFVGLAALRLAGFFDLALPAAAFFFDVGRVVAAFFDIAFFAGFRVVAFFLPAFAFGAVDRFLEARAVFAARLRVAGFFLPARLAEADFFFEPVFFATGRASQTACRHIPDRNRPSRRDRARG